MNLNTLSFLPLVGKAKQLEQVGMGLQSGQAPNGR